MGNKHDEVMDDMTDDDLNTDDTDLGEPDMKFIGSSEEGVMRSIASRKKLRNKMDADVEAFLRGGGQISEIEDNVMADPPRKPQSNYGSRPI